MDASNLTFRQLFFSDRGKLALEKCGFLDYPNLSHLLRNERLKVGSLALNIPEPYASRLLEALLFLEKPKLEIAGIKSLDEIDNESFQAKPSPMASPSESISLEPGGLEHSFRMPFLSLNGVWEMAEGGDETQRLSGTWADSLHAVVPGSVHTALVQAGRLPDPTYGENQKIARKESDKTWWLRCEFAKPLEFKNPSLVFEGVADRCTVFLNGQKLGNHIGMFGGPEFAIGERLQAQNVLVVKLEPIPFVSAGDPKNPESNKSWRSTAVFNNVYGWHYANLPSLGIWAPVSVIGQPSVSMPAPFIATKNAREGLMDLFLQFSGAESGWRGQLKGNILGENFAGEAYHFSHEVHSDGPNLSLHLQFVIPNPHLWWPNDLGEPNLYRLELTFVPSGGGIPACAETTFGIRTVEMAPLPDGPNPSKYNWTFIINGEQHFVKGAGWCTMDPLMDFSRPRYARLISLAKLQHVMMLRCWGAGMPETDTFYHLCDEQGIMVLQEWPTAWDSHEEQPYEVLEETVRLNTVRLRNHPSLVMWGAGNESPKPYGPAIDMMGRLALELDGTRPYHRGEPWGGSIHNYNCYWGRQHLDHNLNMTANFFGEFGLACMPMFESVQRYLPDDEKDLWPAPADKSFAYHTPIFNTREDLSRLTQYARYFVLQDCTMEAFTIGSQLSQATGVRHPLELARTRWPECTGALYYKMNDNFPAASWACVDWYGAPKLGHYIFQDAFSPLHAVVIFSKLNFAGTPVELPVFLLDDAQELIDSPWEVRVRVYNSLLEEVKQTSFTGQGGIDSPLFLGNLFMDWEETDSTPLLIVTDVIRSGKVADRTFYWANYEARKGCLFDLPETSLSFETENDRVTVWNTGSLPAVAVNISQPGSLDTFTVDDNYFWLDAGETRTVWVNSIDGLAVSAWNVKSGSKRSERK